MFCVAPNLPLRPTGLQKCDGMIISFRCRCQFRSEKYSSWQNGTEYRVGMKGDRVWTIGNVDGRATVNWNQ